jgi:hypothetical protein
MFLRKSRLSIVECQGPPPIAMGNAIWMAAWPAAGAEPQFPLFYGAAQAERLPRATFRLVAAFGDFPRAQAGRQLLNHIRNALIPAGACILAEPHLPGAQAPTSPSDTVRALATAAGFFHVRTMSTDAQVTLYELRR